MKEQLTLVKKGSQEALQNILTTMAPTINFISSALTLNNEEPLTEQDCLPSIIYASQNFAEKYSDESTEIFVRICILNGANRAIHERTGHYSNLLSTKYLKNCLKEILSNKQLR
ncbi:MAG: hypothetical protein ACRDCA_28580 [Serratia sp. (in: enterobacteria)]|uniref:hypothetical protein n=1 Tax=Serratia sp. (in: enterobacteria) TaxID=616 RepID=UPI003F41A974